MHNTCIYDCRERILKVRESCNTEPVVHFGNSPAKENSIKKTLTPNVPSNDENVVAFKTPPSKTTLDNNTPKVKTKASPSIKGVLKENNRSQTNTGNTIYDHKEFKNILKKKVLTSYDISNLNSDDSTDDEDSPRKAIPFWAKTPNLKVALKKQCLSSKSNADEIFPDVISPPDLNKIFSRKRSRFNKRTSSACWDSPINMKL